MVDGIGSNISSFSKAFPVQSCLSNFTIFINHVHAKIEDHYPEIDQMDFYRYTHISHSWIHKCLPFIKGERLRVKVRKHVFKFESIT